MDAIQISNVTKRYRDTLALEGISFRFEAGRIYGLLGRNGAGKSTLINIIANRIFATDGCVTIDGEPVCENDRVQEKLYCMSEADLYPAGMRVKDIFKWTGSFYGCFDLEKAHKLAEAYELNVNKKVRALSTGYKSIFKLITALCLDVPYVIFDEPVLGLDANHREPFTGCCWKATRKSRAPSSLPPTSLRRSPTSLKRSSSSTGGAFYCRIP